MGCITELKNHTKRLQETAAGVSKSIAEGKVPGCLQGTGVADRRWQSSEAGSVAIAGSYSLTAHRKEPPRLVCP